MHSAIGYCSSSFLPSEPGRLCRGRERWIQAFDSEPVETIHRLVVSGASFTDDSARDAQRGLMYSGLDVASLVRKLFPENHIVAWAEDAHPRQVPDLARGLEAYDQAMPRGPLRRWAVRWSMSCDEEEQLREALGSGSDVLLVLDEPAPVSDQITVSNTGQAPMADGHLDPQNQGGLPEDLRVLLFLLTGYRCDGPPFRGYQPTALPELLGQKGCLAVILIHQDKHAPCIGIYTRSDGSEDLNRLKALGQSLGSLVVPFAIPPMLARWDRALWEMRQTWDAEALGQFPIPESTDGRSWGRRDHLEPPPKVEETEAPLDEETADTVTNEDAEAEEAEEAEEVEAFPDDDFGDLDDAFGDIEVPAEEVVEAEEVEEAGEEPAP